jgi:hypothetical protein
MPMPVSATESVIHSRSFPCPWRAAMMTVPLGELVGVAHEVQQCALPKPHLIGMHRRDVSLALSHNQVAVLRRQRIDGLDDIINQRSGGEGLQAKLHLPGLDLGEVEDVVDQGEQVTARAEHAVEGLNVLF